MNFDIMKYIDDLIRSFDSYFNKGYFYYILIGLFGLVAYLIYIAIF